MKSQFPLWLMKTELQLHPVAGTVCCIWPIDVSPMFHLMVAYNKVTFTLWQTGQVLPKAQALGLLRLCRTLKMLEDLHNHNTDECRKSQLAVVPGLHYQVSTRLVTKPKVCSIKPILTFSLPVRSPIQHVIQAT